MKYKKGFLIICSIIFLFSIASVTASDVNDTIEINEYQNNANEFLQFENDIIKQLEINAVNETDNYNTEHRSQNEILSLNSKNSDVLCDGSDFQYICDVDSGYGSSVKMYVAKTDLGFILKDGQINQQRYFTRHSDGNYYPSCYQEDFLLPGTFKFDEDTYLYTKGPGDVWYYKKVTYPPITSAGIYVDDYDFENYNYPLVGSGEIYSTVSIPIRVIDSKGNGASGGVVITDSSNNQVGFSSLSNGYANVQISLTESGKSRYKVQFNSNNNNVASSSKYFYITARQHQVYVYFDGIDNTDTITARAGSTIRLNITTFGALTGSIAVVITDSKNNLAYTVNSYGVDPVRPHYGYSSWNPNYRVDMPIEPGEYTIKLYYGFGSSIHDFDIKAERYYSLSVTDRPIKISSIDSIGTKIGSTLSFDINVTESKTNAPVNGGYISVIINDKEYQFPVINGSAKVNYYMNNSINKQKYIFTYKHSAVDFLGYSKSILLETIPYNNTTLIYDSTIFNYPGHISFDVNVVADNIYKISHGDVILNIVDEKSNSIINYYSSPVISGIATFNIVLPDNVDEYRYDLKYNNRKNFYYPTDFYNITKIDSLIYSKFVNKLHIMANVTSDNGLLINKGSIYIFLKNKTSNKNLVYASEVKNGKVEFDINISMDEIYQDCEVEYYAPTNYNLYKYETISSKILDIKTYTDIIVVVNTCEYGEKLKPIIKVINRYDNTYYEEGTIVLTKTVSVYVSTNYKTGEKNYKDVLVKEEKKLTKNGVEFDLNKTKIGNYNANFSYYFNKEISNLHINKTIPLKIEKKTLTLVGPKSLNYTAGENITFNISIKDFDRLLDLVPDIKKYESYPYLIPRVDMYDNGILDSSKRNKGIFTYTLCSESWRKSISFEISNTYFRGSLQIPCNVTRIDPIFEICNDGVFNITDKIGIKCPKYDFTNWLHIYDDNNVELNHVGRNNETEYYELPKKAGNNIIHLKYVPNYDNFNSRNPYNTFETDCIINIVKNNPKFSFNIDDEYVVNRKISILVDVINKESVLPTGVATLTINNTTYESKIINNKLSYSLYLPKSGIYSIIFNYDGDDYYNGLNKLIKINVIKQNVKLITNDFIKIIPNSSLSFYIYGLSEFSNKIDLDRLSVKLGDKILESPIINGALTISSDQVKNFNNITVYFSGNDLYNSASKTIKIIKIIDDVEVPNVILNSEELSFNLPSDAQGKVKLNINGNSYESSLLNGNVCFNLSKECAGTYEYIISYAGDNNYDKFTKNGTIVIKTNVNNIVVPHEFNFAVDKTMRISLPNDAEGIITLIINNQNYVYNVSNGEVNIKMPNLEEGRHTYLIIYSGDSRYAPFTKSNSLIVNKLIKTNIVAKDITVVYKSDKYIDISLKDSEGNPVTGVNILININGETTILSVDNIGKTSYSTDYLKPKAYTATITFNGNKKYHKSTATIKVTVKKATPKLTAKAKTFKKSVKTKKYTVTLKTNQNKVMKNTKLTLKVNKKTYTATTNSKGQATFKITKLIKKGTFKATITYNGSAYYNKVTKNINIKCK